MPIAIHVRPKLMIVTAAGSNALSRPSNARYGPKAGRTRKLAMVYSPMTMASVRKAPLSRATRMFGKITEMRIRVQPAPMLWAASVRVRTLIACRPLSTARYIYGNERTT